MTDLETKPPRRIDLLGAELAHGRLSPAAVTVGRAIEAALEAAQRSAGAGWCERVDGRADVEAGPLSAVEAVRRARLALERVERIVGTADAVLLRDALSHGLSFEEMAARHGRTTRRGIASVASRFRSALEYLARAHAARGKRAGEVNDKHAEAAGSFMHRTRVSELT